MIPCALPELRLDSDPRRQRRYHALVMTQLSHSHRVAAGFHPPASLKCPFSAVQGAWRFYGNPRITLATLAGPLLQCACEDVPEACDQWVLVPMDWCNLHLNSHDCKSDRVKLAHSKDMGYELLTALAVSDRTGQPIAPLCLEMRAANGVHSTRVNDVFEAPSVLDGLEPVMKHVQGLKLGKTPVFVVDREADSVGHYRRWNASGLLYVIRADDNRLVLHDCEQRRLGEVADALKTHNGFVFTGPVQYKDRPAKQYVAETIVVLHRPARTHRLDPKTGKARHHNIPGPALPMRLIVSEIRGEEETVLARWLLLSNLPEKVEAARVALWYYWRWEIESYHKLLKGAGQQVECWQQESAEAMSRRLLVAAMAAVVVWRLARDQSDEAAILRDVLVRLSGRQMKRGKNARAFTEPALLAGLGVLLPMLDLLSQYTVEELRKIAEAALPGLIPPSKAAPPSPQYLRRAEKKVV
jgi:hypothetical protein